MIGLRYLPMALASLLLAGCANLPREPSPGLCGATYVFRKMVDDGSAVPACGLPKPSEIAESCGEADGRYEPPDYIFPEYRIRALACRFEPGSKSKVRCSFTIREVQGDVGSPLPGSRAWRRIRKTFTYVEANRIDEESMHVVYNASWKPDSQCIAHDDGF